MSGSIVSTYVNLVRSTRDKQITKLYKETIPKEMYENIQTNFRIDLFTGGSFSQVATSRSTVIARTGITYSNVKATYGKVNDTKKKDTHVSVRNQGMDDNFVYTDITGESRPRIDSSGAPVPGCRTVYFNANERYDDQKFDQGFEGDYWVLYATSDMRTIVVGIPIILFGYKLSSNFGVYVLTKDPETFWSNENSEVRNDVMYYITGSDEFNPEKNATKPCLKKKFTSWYNKPIATAQTYYPEKYSPGSNKLTPEDIKNIDKLVNNILNIIGVDNQLTFTHKEFLLLEKIKNSQLYTPEEKTNFNTILENLKKNRNIIKVAAVLSLLILLRKAPLTPDLKKKLANIGR